MTCKHPVAVIQWCKFIIFYNIAHDKQHVNYEKGAVIIIAMIASFMPHNYGCYAMLSLLFFTILLMISKIAQKCLS